MNAAIVARQEAIIAAVHGDPLELMKRQNPVERTRVITVRMPATFHSALLEAVRRDRGGSLLSLNKLCVRELFRDEKILADAAMFAAEAEVAANPQLYTPPPDATILTVPPEQVA